MILCSPHNPGGRVWTKGELQAVAAFAKRHDLVLISDEIHHDLTMPGQTHIPMTRIEGVASIESSFALSQVKHSNALPLDAGS